MTNFQYSIVTYFFNPTFSLNTQNEIILKAKEILSSHFNFVSGTSADEYHAGLVPVNSHKCIYRASSCEGLVEVEWFLLEAFVYTQLANSNGTCYLNCDLTKSINQVSYE